MAIASFLWIFITGIIVVFVITIYALCLPWYYRIFHKQFCIEKCSWIWYPSISTIFKNHL